jgi:formate hydrogenlyase transcriptional activator
MAILDLIGSSPKFRALLTEVERVAPVDSAVLIQGETGTGKEVIARAIHEASPRRNQRFVALNRVAIPSALLESDPFGHERGAFTGARTQTKGRSQMADGGTFFVDEIGDMPLELQPKLLPDPQEREFERLGSAQTVLVNVRVVAATNQAAEDFLNCGQQQKTGCLIADIRMPGMSGLDLKAKLNADHCPIPTIFITAHGDEKMRL